MAAARFQRAKVWLKAEMMAGPRKASELDDLRRAQGIARSTLAEARKSLGIVSERIDNQYLWHYPRQKVKK